MSTTMKKTTERLSWNTLIVKYSTLRAVDADTAKDKLFEYLNDAVAKDAADLHDGDTHIVLKAVKNNCVSDKQSRLKTATASNSYIAMADIKKALLVAMIEYCDAKMPAKSTSTIAITTSSPDKARWELSMEEIDAIHPRDYAALKSVYDCMASKKAKYPEAIPDMDDFMLRYRHVSALKSAASKEPVVPVVSDKLSAKLEAGKTSFTKSEVEELRKLLNK